MRTRMKPGRLAAWAAVAVAVALALLALPAAPRALAAETMTREPGVRDGHRRTPLARVSSTG